MHVGVCICTLCVTMECFLIPLGNIRKIYRRVFMNMIFTHKVLDFMKNTFVALLYFP